MEQEILKDLARQFALTLSRLPGAFWLELRRNGCCRIPFEVVVKGTDLNVEVDIEAGHNEVRLYVMVDDCEEPSVTQPEQATIDIPFSRDEAGTLLSMLIDAGIGEPKDE